MATKYISYALLGVKISVKHLLRTEEHPQCEHKVPEGSINCPVCGKMVGTFITTYWDRVEELRSHLSTQYDHGYVWVDRTYDDIDPVLYYGFGVSSDQEDGETRHFRVPDQGSLLPTIRARTENFPMIDFALWGPEVEKSYGLYSLTVQVEIDE